MYYLLGCTKLVQCIISEPALNNGAYLLLLLVHSLVWRFVCALELFLGCEFCAACRDPLPWEGTFAGCGF